MGDIVIVAAVAKNGVIGLRDDLPWHYPEDLAHFKALTMGQKTVMGRATYDSILRRLGHPLTDRRSIVVTSRPLDAHPDVDKAASLEEAIFNHPGDLYVIGGAQLYTAALPIATHMELTHILKEYEGDTYFPPISNDWTMVSMRRSGDLVFKGYRRT